MDSTRRSRRPPAGPRRRPTTASPLTSKTREYAWPEVESFLDGRSATHALDVGCGNGRHTELLAARSASVVGVDLSRELLREATTRARERGFDAVADFVHGDAAALPIADESIDLAVYVATLHHLSPRDVRVRSASTSSPACSTRTGTALVSASGAPPTTASTARPGSTRPSTGPSRRRDRPAVLSHLLPPSEFERDLEASDLEPIDIDISSGNCYAVVTAPEHWNINIDTVVGGLKQPCRPRRCNGYYSFRTSSSAGRARTSSPGVISRSSWSSFCSYLPPSAPSARSRTRRRPITSKRTPKRTIPRSPS